MQTEIITGAVASLRSCRISQNPSTAKLKGNVKITRGPNQIEGDAAEVDTKTGVSKMLASPEAKNNSGRVRGLLIPGSNEVRTVEGAAQ